MRNGQKYTIATAIFVAGFLAANTLGTKITTILGVSVSVGIFAYPLTFMITDAVAEVYGKQKAKQIVWGALIAQLLVLLLILISIKMPPSERYTLNTEYTKIFSSSIRMIIASLIAFIVSQTYDIWAFDFWKRKTKGRFLWLRNNLSTFTSQAIDTLLFMFIAFYGITAKFDTAFGSWVFLCFYMFRTNRKYTPSGIHLGSVST